MARSVGMSQSAVSRIWRAFGLKPHIIQTWKLSLPATPARMTHDYVRNGTTSLFAAFSEWNKDPRPFIWTKTADEILGTLAAYCEQLLTHDTG
jgi:hypothetical protein